MTFSHTLQIAERKLKKKKHCVLNIALRRETSVNSSDPLSVVRFLVATISESSAATSAFVWEWGRCHCFYFCQPFWHPPPNVVMSLLRGVKWFHFFPFSFPTNGAHVCVWHYLVPSSVVVFLRYPCGCVVPVAHFSFLGALSVISLSVAGAIL
ncbi:transmembrane protein, putative [Bodo saltans]|uniref:Transmembrane protein, putative n=1 Tax=Bodo saltans TaxID=75058 RepID=A0A0S4JH72_BODSA|nr:transmembrane protein, putative [Bodo saltans]|eukprot:CUG90820.1 transmembrane protein, putative [Bodo saltans]